jgi:hypothetical protein
MTKRISFFINNQKTRMCWYYFALLLDLQFRVSPLRVAQEVQGQMHNAIIGIVSLPIRISFAVIQKLGSFTRKPNITQVQIYSRYIYAENKPCMFEITTLVKIAYCGKKEINRLEEDII